MTRPIYQMPLLKENQRLFHAISLVKDGNMSFKWGEFSEVLSNRKTWFAKIGIDMDRSVNMATQDSDSIAIVTSADKGKGMHTYQDAVKTDGLITKDRELTLCLLTADCLPIIFYDPVEKVLALGHLGWRGTDAKLSQKIIRRMREEFNTDPKDLLAAICPGIQQESFVFKDPIQKQLPDWAPFLADLPDNQTSIDLLGFNRQQLIDIGVKDENIEISSVDTAKDPQFFSHYRSARTGEKEGRFFTCVKMID